MEAQRKRKSRNCRDADQPEFPEIRAIKVVPSFYPVGLATNRQSGNLDYRTEGTQASISQHGGIIYRDPDLLSETIESWKPFLLLPIAHRTPGHDDGCRPLG